VLGARDAEAFERHLRKCAACRRRAESHDRLRDLASSLPHREPSPLALRRLRARLLRSMAGGDPLPGMRPWRPFAIATVVALVVALGAGGWSLLRTRRGPPALPAAASASPAASPADSPARAGTVTSTPEARWSQTRRGGVEEVALAAGAIHVVVRRQFVGECFLVELPDGEIEVRGTTFDVDVADGATRRVQVTEGVVELRLRGRSAIRLGPSESWSASSDGVSASAPSAHPSPARPAVAVASPPGADDFAGEYAEGVQRLRDGRYDEAASRFRAFVVAHPSAAEAEDASFLEAVALARAGRADAAAHAGEQHLSRFPRSFHAKEAAILVARSASQRHDCEKARRVLAPWSAAAAEGDDVHAALGWCGADSEH
jgi:hypothetical protein